MRNLTTTLIAILAAATVTTPAVASSEEVTLNQPTIELNHERGFLALTTYTIPQGDAAKITYKVFRHRMGAGFKLVRVVHHVVAAADGFDSATLKTPLFFGVGYRIKTRLVDVSNGTRIVAPVVKIRV